MRDFRDEFKHEYSGAPFGRRAQLLAWFRPRGGTTADGVRLAVLNVAGIVVAALVLFAARVLDRVVGLPFLFSGFFIALALIALAAFGWQRYARAHGAAARARGRGTRPDLFGGIGAVPFLFIGVFQIGTGALRLLFAMVTFSAHRALAATETMGLGVLFVALAGGLVLIAREAVS